MVPAFRVMQERIDQINRVLREQITGIRVVRAFVREPQEAVRFQTANQELTDVSLRSGRLMGAMFPTSQLIINLASVAVLWIGANRITAGDINVGALVAYLSYLVQILMSVMMATFVISMIPRAAVSAGAHPRGARDRLLGAAPRRAGRPGHHPRRARSSATSASTTPAPSTRC